jgi:hypothetical protein
LQAFFVALAGILGNQDGGLSTTRMFRDGNAPVAQQGNCGVVIGIEM